MPGPGMCNVPPAGGRASRRRLLVELEEQFQLRVRAVAVGPNEFIVRLVRVSWSGFMGGADGHCPRAPTSDCGPWDSHHAPSKTLRAGKACKVGLACVLLIAPSMMRAALRSFSLGCARACTIEAETREAAASSKSGQKASASEYEMAVGRWGRVFYPPEAF